MKYITAVDYRHIILTAYITVIGKSTQQAERRAHTVADVLRRQVPRQATVLTPRYRGYKGGFDTYEVPILVGNCEAKIRPILARIVLQGRVNIEGASIVGQA